MDKLQIPQVPAGAEVGQKLFEEGFKTFSFQVGNLTISPNYLEAFLVVFLVFFLILAMARMRRLFINWSFKGAAMGIFLGFVLAIIVEGFLLLGGHTVLTSLFGWKNAPKPIQQALDRGRGEFIKVLGAQTTNCDQ